MSTSSVNLSTGWLTETLGVVRSSSGACSDVVFVATIDNDLFSKQNFKNLVVNFSKVSYKNNRARIGKNKINLTTAIKALKSLIILDLTKLGESFGTPESTVGFK